MGSDVEFGSIREQGRLFRRRRISPLELVKVYLERIRAHDGKLCAFTDVFEEEAVSNAEAATEELMNGIDRGPLHGIPFAVKDIFAIHGRLPTAGSRIEGFRLHATQATVISRLQAAGAILLGALNTHELQFGITRDFAFGTPRNPWDIRRATGGSSAGSAAAVAAGFCTFSLGGDTGASIRTPAALCGIVGLRPTWSRVSRHGAMSLHPELDCVGPMGRFVEDVAIVLEAIAGRDERDQTSSKRAVESYERQLGQMVGPSVVGSVHQMTDPERLDPGVKARIDEATHIVGISNEVRQVELPLISKYPAVFPAVMFDEVSVRYRAVLREKFDDLDANTRTTLLASAAVPAATVIQAKRIGALIARQILAAFDEHEVLVGATTHRTAGVIPDEPYPIRVEDPRAILNGRQGSEGQMERRSFSLAGVPALSVPCGYDDDGLPVGLHIAGRPFEEGLILRMASVVQHHFGWRPPPAFV